jgi:hypothetical protein
VLKQLRKALLAWRYRRLTDGAMLSLDGSYVGLLGVSSCFFCLEVAMHELVCLSV